VSADARRAAEEVLAGQPQAAARRWLGPTVLVMLALFALDTVLVVTHVLLTPFDIPIATLVQSINWGPVVYVFQLINVSAGIWQVLIGAVAVVGMFIAQRRDRRRAPWTRVVGLRALAPGALAAVAQLEMVSPEVESPSYLIGPRATSQPTKVPIPMPIAAPTAASLG